MRIRSRENSSNHSNRSQAETKPSKSFKKPKQLDGKKLLHVLESAIVKLVEKKKKKIIRHELKNVRRAHVSDPMRPFQEPPTLIDLTADNQYETKWRPIERRNPDKREPRNREDEQKEEMKFKLDT